MIQKPDDDDDREEEGTVLQALWERPRPDLQGERMLNVRAFGESTTLGSSLIPQVDLASAT